ncbi:MAG: hypothetical protein K9H16_09945 [Bacteroidales bacterium]|nr:hypothetical protein [Bacteroidales bacterium]
MKALKAILVLALVSFTMAGFADYPDKKSDDRTVVPLKLVLDKPAYVNALLNQVNTGSIFNNDRGEIIVVKIRVYNMVYLVAGTYGEWKRFFETEHLLPFFKKSPDGMPEDK